MTALAEHPNELAQQLTGHDYLSWSAVSSYRSCPLRYFFRYVEQLPEPTVSSSLVFGAAIHAAIEHWFWERLAGMEPTPESLLEEYQREWQTRDARSITFGKNEDAGSLHELADRVLTAFVAGDAARPPGRIVGIEEELRSIIIPGCPDILARLDLVVETDDAVTVTDFKTSRSRWSREQAEQLLLYSALVQEFSPGKEIRLEFLVVTKTKTPSIDRHSVPVTQAKIDRTCKTVAHVWQGIESRLFYPAPSPMSCGGCPFQHPWQAWSG